ncbi:hypothetical protein [Flagellimonas sp. 2504JD4-2]
MAQRKKRWGIYLVLGITFFSGFMVYLMFTSETNTSVVNLVLQKDGKTYLYSYLGDQAVQSSIQMNESPVIFPFIQLFEDDDKLYAAPDKLEDIVNLICGNYQIYDYPEKSSDGYVTSGNMSCFQTLFKNQTTENIGEQIRTHTAELTDLDSGNDFEIKWNVNTKTYESEALENCQEKSFMIKTSVQPGEFVISSKDFIMVDLQGVINFYGKKVNARLNKEEQLLYIQYKD